METNFLPENQGLAHLSNGTSIYYDAFGPKSAPVVLLIMGLDAQCLVFDRSFMKPMLEHGFRCIRFDNRDIGKSTWFNGTWNRKAPYTLEDMAEDTVLLLDHLGIEQAHLLGVSMGGMIAQTIACDYPGRVLSLCSMMSTAWLFDPSQAIRFSERLYLPFLPWLFRHFHVKIKWLHPEISVRFYMNMFRYLNGRKFPFDAEAVRALMTEAIVERGGQNPRARYQQFCAIVASGSRKRKIGQLAIPMLIIHGTSDPIIPVSHARAMAVLNPRAKLVLVEGMGHTFPPSTFPYFYEALLGHLRAEGG